MLASEAKGKKPSTRDRSFLYFFSSADVRARGNQAVPAPQVRVGGKGEKPATRDTSLLFIC